MPYPFRHAICNEVFEKWKFADTCKAIRRAGYAGIEIAPFTLAEDPAAITGAQRSEYRAVMESEGLAFVGLHWLMVAPKGLHVTTPDKALREKSWLHVRRLVDLCAGLGPDVVMIFGSPKQRNAVSGLSRAQATRHFVDGLAAIAPHAAERGVTILVEALPPKDTDVVTSLDEAAAVVREINHPAIRTMFDTHNAIAEVEPHASLVDRYFDLIRHLHVNEMDGRHPGTGDYDFKSVLKVFARRGYQKWVSLEVFDFSAGAEKIASDSLRFLQGEIKRLGV